LLGLKKTKYNVNHNENYNLWALMQYLTTFFLLLSYSGS